MVTLTSIWGMAGLGILALGEVMFNRCRRDSAADESSLPLLQYRPKRNRDRVAV